MTFAPSAKIGILSVSVKAHLSALASPIAHVLAC